MTYRPSFEQFRESAREGKLVPVYVELFSDMLTPVMAYQKLASGERSFLFESVIGGEKVGRYSFVGTGPFLTMDATRDVVTLHTEQEDKTYRCSDPLKELDQLVSQYQAVHLNGLPRFSGGAVGFASYDSVRYTENLPNAPEDDRGLPDLSFSFYDEMIIFDHIRKTILIVALVNPATEGVEAAYQRAQEKIGRLRAKLQSPVAASPLYDVTLPAETTLPFTSNFTQAEFEDVVLRCQEYIKAGDIFQVVCSQRLQLETKATSLDIYRALRVVNPSPFMFLLELPGFQLVGSSPEIMCRVEDGEVTVRPLAGTRPRGKTPQEDLALAEDLLADPKERAEHIMLVDLARNDIGRVAQYGSVKISDVMVVERYSHVMHITSNATGQLKPGLTALDALRASLPAGTVSGAPKVRAMQIIDEMEKHRRGPYAGAVGYIDFTGNMDTCIALRTLVLKGTTAYLQAGAGLVADSVPSAEYQETLNKARGLLKAIELAENQFAQPGK